MLFAMSSPLEGVPQRNEVDTSRYTSIVAGLKLRSFNRVPSRCPRGVSPLESPLKRPLKIFEMRF